MRGPVNVIVAIQDKGLLRALPNDVFANEMTGCNLSTQSLKALTMLDKTNRRLLDLLAENARTSFTDLATEVGLSRTAVQDRIARMERDGVIAGYRVDAPVVSAPPFQALVSLEITTRPCAPTLQKLRRIKGVHQVFSVTGTVDAVLQISAGSSAELSSLIDRIAAVPYVGNVSSQVILARIS